MSGAENVPRVGIPTENKAILELVSCQTEAGPRGPAFAFILLAIFCEKRNRLHFLCVIGGGEKVIVASANNWSRHFALNLLQCGRFGGDIDWPEVAVQSEGVDFPVAPAGRGTRASPTFAAPFPWWSGWPVARLRRVAGVETETGGTALVRPRTPPEAVPFLRAAFSCLGRSAALLRPPAAGAVLILALQGASAWAEPVDLVPYAGPPPPSLDVPLLTLSGPPLVQTRTVPDAGADVLVVHFFATWCEPCRAELPALSRLSARLPGVRVVLVDVAEPEARVRRFFEEVAPPGPILMDQDRAAVRAFGVEMLPSTLVFAAGLPRLQAVGEVAWDDPKVEAQLSALVPGGAGKNAAGKNGS